jgi:plastocyanin
MEPLPLDVTTPRHRARRWFPVAFLILAAIAALHGQERSAGGSVRGKLTLVGSEDVSEEILRGKRLTRYEGHAAMSTESVEPYRLSESAVVYIEQAGPRETYTPPDDHPRLNQTQMVFRPLVLPVLVGTTVDFPNNDNVFHNVFSYSQPREFDLGRYPKVNVRSVRFEKPGPVKVYCDIHSYMYATILVLENPYFAAPDDDGSFELSGIPEGTYDLTYWYGRKKAATKRVTVKADQTTMVNFP